MLHRYGCDIKFIFLDNDTFFHRHECQIKGSVVAAQDNSINQIVHAAQGSFAPIYFQGIDRFPAQQGGEQSCQAQNMIEMTMRDQNTIEAFKSNPRLQNLSLGAFPTID